MSSINKIEELVFKGMVLDEHGGWIPIAEKIRKEKEFLYHLEQGEVLYNDIWTKMSDIPRTAGHPEETKRIAVCHVPVTDETTPLSLETPEETVSDSTKTLRDLSQKIVTIEPETDFPPETKIFSIAHPNSNVSPLGQEDTPINKRDLPPSSVKTAIENSPGSTAAGHTKAVPMAPPETEFEETVVYNIDLLRQTEISGQDTRSFTLTTASRPMSDSRRMDDFLTDFSNQTTKKKILAAAVVIVAIFIITVLLRFFL